METETVYDNEFATILYYPESGIIQHSWKKFCSGPLFREMMLGASDYLEAHKGTKWLSDDRKYTIMSEEDSLWGRRVWVPRTIHAGWKHWAMILPEINAGTEAMQGIVNEFRAAGINAAFFDDVPEAMAWLEKQ